MQSSNQSVVRWKTSANGGRENETLSGHGRRNDNLDAQQTDPAIIKQIDGVYDRMKAAFEQFLAVQGWTNARAYRELSPYISNPAAVTKILKGDQSLPFQVILLMLGISALIIRFNEPLDEILIGEKLETPSLTKAEQEVILHLAERIKACSRSKV